MPDALERTLQPTRRALGDVDPAQPLDLTHPLLRGVQGFWLPLPHLTGGSRLYDLSSFSRHGDLTNMDPTTDWVTDSEIAYPGLNYEKSNAEAVRISDDAIISGSQNRTLMAYVRWNGSQVGSRGKGLFSNHPAGGGTGNAGERWAVKIQNINKIRIEIQGDGFSASPFFIGNKNIFAACSLNGDTLGDHTLYIDGESEKASGSSSVNTNSDYVTEIGRWQVDSGDTWPGDIWSVILLDRAITTQEMQQWENQARRGFPDLLRRRDSVGLLGGGGSPTADTVSFDTATALADGFDPTITATANTVSPGTAQAAAQGFSASITATENTVNAGTAQAAAQGFAPTITTGSNTIAATTGQAPAQGFDPTISEGASGDTLVADLGAAQAQGFAPSISTNPATVTLGIGQAADKGFDPDVVADPSVINTQQAQATATGFDPSITASPRTVSVQTAQASAEGFEPAVVDGTVGVATTMEIEARPKYEITLEARPLYRIRLFAKEKLP